MAKKCVLALDCGTTGNRAILFDSKLKVAGQAYQEFRQYYPKPGWVEHDAGEIWSCVRSVMAKARKAAGRVEIIAVGITNQRETVVIWDPATGKPVCKAIVWQCRRSADICEGWKKRGLSKTIHRKTGLFLDPYFSGSKIHWLLKNNPKVRKGIQSGRYVAGTIDAWIVWKLTGGKSFMTDPTNASRTMMFNLKTGKWDPALLKLVGIKASNLPAVQPTCSDFGTTSVKETGFSAPIRSVVGDQQSAAFAQGCGTKGIIKNTYGTGLFVVSETGSSVKMDDHLITTVAASDGHDLQYAFEGSVFIGGAGIQWLRDGLNLIKEADETEKIALSTDSNGGVYFVPALVGLGCPHWNSHARGLFTGITRGTTAAHFVRAGLEAMAFSTKDVIDAMVKTSGIRVKSLRVDGGAVRNNFLMQFQADLLNVPVERPRITETTALGAAGLAGIAAGFWKNRRDFLKLNPVEKVFKPKMKPAERKRLCTEWTQAVRRTL